MVNEAIRLDYVLDISKRLSLTDQLSLVSQLSEWVRRELDRDSEPIDMLALAGLGADLWQKIDVDAYLEQERASWES